MPAPLRHSQAGKAPFADGEIKARNSAAEIRERG